MVDWRTGGNGVFLPIGCTVCQKGSPSPWLSHGSCIACWHRFAFVLSKLASRKHFVGGWLLVFDGGRHPTDLRCATVFDGWTRKTSLCHPWVFLPHHVAKSARSHRTKRPYATKHQRHLPYCVRFVATDGYGWHLDQSQYRRESFFEQYSFKATCPAHLFFALNRPSKNAQSIPNPHR